jgi:hypothetical protein
MTGRHRLCRKMGGNLRRMFGDICKGFAQVANEIKDLAKETAVATLDIKTKIQGDQQVPVLVCRKSTS